MLVGKDNISHMIGFRQMNKKMITVDIFICILQF